MSRKLIIDGNEIEVDNATTLMHACEAAGAEIPRFCYHERLSIAGNCRMCLVEVEGSLKPIASCAMLVNDLPPTKDGSPKKISTKSELVRKAREGVLEFLLLNHPLDCPICDQGGECDLQDQAMAFGLGGSRYEENKRAVEDKYIGPLIKTVMTRCIHCTRCVRYMTEVAGVEELGLIGRGEDAEITTYLEKGIASEMSANVVDLCPVGALTHRPWAHNCRPWELKKTETIDVMDALGSSIRVDARGNEVMRILPRNNDAINEEWISDKTRHVVDGLKSQRLDRPYIRKNGRLQDVSWTEALNVVADRLKNTDLSRIGAIVGDLSGVEEIFALKELMKTLGVQKLDCRQAFEKINTSYGRAGYLFNSTIEGIEIADACILVGSNPRIEAPVLNARIRKRVRQGDLKVFLIGEAINLGYPYFHIGSTAADIKKISALDWENYQRPMCILGMGAVSHPLGETILAQLAQTVGELGIVKDDWNGFNILHTAAARVGALEVGFVPSNENESLSSIINGGVDLLYNLGADEINIPSGPFVIYQGSHGDAGAERADVILPGASYTEKSATYINMEGRVQQTVKSIFPPGDAQEDWKIIRALSEKVGHTLSFDTLDDLRTTIRKERGLENNLLLRGSRKTFEMLSNLKNLKQLDETNLQSTIKDFYLTNSIARASRTMSELSRIHHSNRRQGSFHNAAAE
ncbi:MAG: NADH-quinone oxidoreductase subunit NuoG [Hyphomicrobium sp.]